MNTNRTPITKCPDCGARLKSGIAKCEYCGGIIPGAYPASSTVYTPPPAASKYTPPPVTPPTYTPPSGNRYVPPPQGYGNPPPSSSSYNSRFSARPGKQLNPKTLFAVIAFVVIFGVGSIILPVVVSVANMFLAADDEYYYDYVADPDIYDLSTIVGPSVSYYISGNQYVVTLTGSIRNDYGSRISASPLKFTIYDSEGKSVGTQRVYYYNWYAGEIMHFNEKVYISVSTAKAPASASLTEADLSAY